MSTTCPERFRGFAIVSAIFILVVLAALAGFVVSLTATQSITFAQDIQGARAYLAARAGVEWGLYRWLVDGTCTTTGAPTTIDGFTITMTMSSTPTTPVFCTIGATASTGGSVGAIGFIERQLSVVVEGI